MIYIKTYLEMFYYILPTSLFSAESLVIRKSQLESACLMFHVLVL